MKKTILLVILLITYLLPHAQNDLLNEISLTKIKMSDKEFKLYNRFQKDSFVREVRIIRINFEQFTESKLVISISGEKTIVTRIKLDARSNSDFSWFGTLTDETGIFFSVLNNQVTSKFYLNNIPYTILPLNDSYHLLIAYKSSIDNFKCGNGLNLKNIDGKQIFTPRTNNFFLKPLKTTNDDNCRMRVLLVVTNQAKAEIGIDLNLAARMMEDETNLAYMQSQIIYRMEIARVEITSYVETTSWSYSTEYGYSTYYPNDLLNLRNGSGFLSNVPILRENYDADVVVMVESEATMSSEGLFGYALGIPRGSYVPDENNAYVLISTEHAIGGRFNIAHEIGHIQGARHDDDNDIPTYARGYIFRNAPTNNRTIMAQSCNQNNGCIVQFFSNPNISYAGSPLGIVDVRDNHRRINETSTYVLNFRTTPDDLLLQTETFADEILARYVANITISTNSNVVNAQSGSVVSLRAVNQITLLPGFEASSGSDFIAYIDNCSNEPLLKPNNILDQYISKNQEGDNYQNKIRYDVHLYPNPAHHKVYLSLPLNAGETEVKILNAIGVLQKTLHQKANNKNQNIEIDIEDFPQGIYFIQLTNNSGVITTQKFIKD